jgi:hypothetical protein
MMKVDLPVVDLDLGLREAIHVMKRSRRGGVLVGAGNRLRVIDGADIVSMARQGGQSLSEVRTRTDVSSSPSPARPKTGMRGVIAFGPKLRAVNIEDDALAARVAGEILFYYCNGKRRHGFGPNEVQPGQDCPYGDGTIVG